MAAALDGDLYFVLDRSLTAGETELGRLDPARGVVETVRLPLAAEGELSMAGGRDGLYVAGTHGGDGRWSIAWNAIAKAGWRKLASARLVDR
jgi:hypothetical protein